MVVIPFQNIMEDVERLKKEAGVAACDFIKDGMKLGLGTGSTVRYTVIEIGRSAFAYNFLSSLTIPDSVTSVGWGAFRFNNLTNLSIGNNVISIGDGAFYTNQLTELIVPEGVTEINVSLLKHLLIC